MTCSVQEYRTITNDTDSLDDDIYHALDMAQQIVERKTNRAFELKDRVEVLKVYRNGRVYPKATPVVEVTSINYLLDATSPGGAGVPATWLWSDRYATASVAYRGGFTEDKMPEEIVRAVAEIAEAFLTKDVESEFPAGARTVHVGDVSLSLDASVTSRVIPSHIEATLREWKRREI